MLDVVVPVSSFTAAKCQRLKVIGGAILFLCERRWTGNGNLLSGYNQSFKTWWIGGSQSISTFKQALRFNYLAQQTILIIAELFNRETGLAFDPWQQLNHQLSTICNTKPTLNGTGPSIKLKQRQVLMI
jgi:hypothetical protein